ncbi:hypothetical protein Tco_1484222 [Tanacetum coccineum]
MARQTEANEHMKNQVVELKRQINQGFNYLEKTQHTKSLPRTINTKPRYEIIYNPPSIRNENKKGGVKFIEEDAIKPIPTMPNLSLIISNSPSVSPYLKDCIVHIPYTNANMFADDVLPNHVGDEELNSIDGVGAGKMTKKKNKGMPKELNKE